MPQDPQCEDIVVRAGAKDTYYYSNANMSDNYAMIAQLIEDKDLCVMFAEMVRFNARVYPSATPLKYFQRSPYGLAPEEIEQTWKTMQGQAGVCRHRGADQQSERAVPLLHPAPHPPLCKSHQRCG